MLTSGGTIQGYNGQALVDDKHQIIVHGQAFAADRMYKGDILYCGCQAYNFSD
jgi:hypothetical protein